MKTKIYLAVLSAAIAITMTACGTISPPLQTATETAITTTAESLPDSAASSEAESTVDEEQVKSDTFIAELFNSNISFTDVSPIVTEAMKGCSFETEKDASNGVQKISLKGKNGGGMIDVLCIDLSQSDLDHDMEYILENFGDYYFGQTSAQFCMFCAASTLSRISAEVSARLSSNRSEQSILRTFTLISIRSSSGLLSLALYCRICLQVQVHLFRSGYMPQGQGFRAATSINPAGYIYLPWILAIVTSRSSNGCRITSRTFLPNSGSSSRNNTPL